MTQRMSCLCEFVPTHRHIDKHTGLCAYTHAHNAHTQLCTLIPVHLRVRCKHTRAFSYLHTHAHTRTHASTHAIMYRPRVANRVLHIAQMYSVLHTGRGPSWPPTHLSLPASYHLPALLELHLHPRPLPRSRYTVPPSAASPLVLWLGRGARADPEDIPREASGSFLLPRGPTG